MNSPFDKLNTIKPKTPNVISPEIDAEVERVSETHGFVQDITRTKQRYRRKPGAIKEPTVSVSMRVLVDDWNTFVDFCEKERYSYKEGFSALIKSNNR